MAEDNVYLGSTNPMHGYVRLRKVSPQERADQAERKLYKIRELVQTWKDPALQLSYDDGSDQVPYWLVSSVYETCTAEVEAILDEQEDTHGQYE